MFNCFTVFQTTIILFKSRLRECYFIAPCVYITDRECSSISNGVVSVHIASREFHHVLVTTAAGGMVHGVVLNINNNNKTAVHPSVYKRGGRLGQFTD